MSSRLFLPVIAVLIVSNVSFAGEEVSHANALSFETFSRKVLEYYPKLKAAHSGVDIALAKQMQAQAGFWPSLNLSAGYTISDDPVNVFGMLLRQERFASSDFALNRLNAPEAHQDLSAGVHVELPLFDAMQTIGRTRSAREMVKASQADAAFTKMEALLMAQDAYLNAMTFEKLSAVINEVYRSSEEDLQKAKDLKDRGVIFGADYYSAKVMFGDFTRMKNELARQRKAMNILLNILMGEPLNKVWLLTSSVREADTPSQDQEKLIDAAFISRPDVFSLNARLLALESESSRARASALPRVSAFGDVTNDRNGIGDAGGNNYTVGIKAEMPLFDPSRKGRILEAESKKVQLEYDVQLLKDGIRRDITEEFARNSTLRDNVTVLKDMTDDATAAVGLLVPLYSEGRKSIVDLFEVRRAYLQSSQAYDKALIGIRLSEAKLLFLSGRLNENEISKLEEGVGQ
ncbi:MAG TPA: TolC family protein [Pontiellaceae bacterium]|nr:TolC family protein [Pontiellaceae bacterium]